MLAEGFSSLWKLVVKSASEGWNWTLMSQLVKAEVALWCLLCQQVQTGRRAEQGTAAKEKEINSKVMEKDWAPDVEEIMLTNGCRRLSVRRWTLVSLYSRMTIRDVSQGDEPKPLKLGIRSLFPRSRLFVLSFVGWLSPITYVVTTMHFMSIMHPVVYVNH